MTGSEQVEVRDSSAPTAAEEAFYANLGEAIRTRRIQLGMSQLQFGRAVGYAQPSVFSVESGHWRITVHMLLRIAEALDVSPFDLIEDGWR